MNEKEISAPAETGLGDGIPNSDIQPDVSPHISEQAPQSGEVSPLPSADEAQPQDAAQYSYAAGVAGKPQFWDFVHPVSFALFILAGFSAVLLFAFYQSADFADFYSRHIGSVFRFILAKLSDPFPFSVAETIIFSLPIFVGAVIAHTVRLSKQSAAKNCRFIMALLSILTLLFSLFVLTFAAAYRGSTLEEKLGLERKYVSAAELAATANALAKQIEGVLDEVRFNYGSFSVMPYPLDEMTKKLNDAFEKVCEKYPFVQPMRTRVKPVVLSELMTYTHISGVYSYFTGEANLNVNFPDYMLPYTAAHELSHQRGIAREDEANFMAFLVCIESDDPYIRYSGYVNVLGYVLSSLYSADPAEYMKVWRAMDRRVVFEFASYSEFFDKYRESKVSKVSETINDTYLKIQGQAEGTRSYGRVVDLAVAYAKVHLGAAEG